MTIRPFGGPLRLFATVTRERAGGYSVMFPQLPGCFSEGDTLRQARLMATEAAEACIQALVEEDRREIVLDAIALPDGRTLRRKDGAPIRFQPFTDSAMPGYDLAADESLGVDVWAKTRDELAETVAEALAVNWTEYAECDPAGLTREARALRRRLRAAFEASRDE